MRKILKVFFFAGSVAFLIYIGYYFHISSVEIGQYTVYYYKNQTADVASFPSDLTMLMNTPGVVKIIWLEQIGPNIYQRYCWTADRGVEKSGLVRKYQ
ncbi:MAG: hypothetical protein ACE14T_03645 [Syntrophales bacterium]